MLSPSPSRTPLPDTIKKRLKSLIIELRRMLEDDLGKQLKRLGFDAAKSAATPIEKLAYLTAEEIAVRRVLDVIAAKEQSVAGSYAAGIEALRREAAYTHLNRLVGLKCLELRGHLSIDGEPTEVVTVRSDYGDRSKWLWVLRERDPRYRFGEDAEEILWREGLTQACAAITVEIGVLFDPADPYAQVWPSHRALRAAIDRLNDVPDEAFRADELLGWVYQYFQSDEKDRVFEAVRTQKTKIAGADIMPVTQLYTEQYMVDFLLQNSLGARKEIPFFQQLATDGKIALSQLRDLDPDPAKKTQEIREVKDFLCAPFNITHFACHAIYDNKAPQKSYVLLTDKFPISIQDIEVYDVALNDHPLIIMNACETGNLNPLYTSHFAAVLLKHGARGVVATECAVPDDFAADFAEQLYTHLLAGETLGDSLLATRRYFLEEHNNPAGLLYSMYAPPSIRLVRAL